MQVLVREIGNFRSQGSVEMCDLTFSIEPVSAESWFGVNETDSYFMVIVIIYSACILFAYRFLLCLVQSY